jgi:ribosomal protein S18 acetylase RimI-like enzyme
MDVAIRRRGIVSAIVRRLVEGDYHALREIRLEALRLHPEAFCADLAQEEAMSKDEWLARLESAATFGAFSGDQLDGIAVFSRPSRPKLAHTGDLSAMYVRAPARGTGVADGLLRAVIDHAAGEVDQIKLTVNADNARAVRLYERHGFRIVGRVPHYVRVGDRLYDELIMLRGVSPSD